MALVKKMDKLQAEVRLDDERVRGGGVDGGEYSTPLLVLPSCNEVGRWYGKVYYLPMRGRRIEETAAVLAGAPPRRYQVDR